MNIQQKKALIHKNILGAGAEARSHLKPSDKMAVVMEEFKHHTLHSGNGEIVTNPKQAIAIGLSEMRRHKK